MGLLIFFHWEVLKLLGIVGSWPILLRVIRGLFLQEISSYNLALHMKWESSLFALLIQKRSLSALHSSWVHYLPLHTKEWNLCFFSSLYEIENYLPSSHEWVNHLPSSYKRVPFQTQFWDWNTSRISTNFKNRLISLNETQQSSNTKPVYQKRNKTILHKVEPVELISSTWRSNSNFDGNKAVY